MPEVEVGTSRHAPGRAPERGEALGAGLPITVLERLRLGAEWVEPDTVIAVVHLRGISPQQFDKALASGRVRVRAAP